MERKDDAQPPRSAYEEFIAFLDSKEGKDFARFVDELDEAIDCKYPGWIESTTRKGERAAAKRAGIAEASGELAAEQPARREASRKAEGLDRSDRQHEVESQTASVGEQSPESGQEHTVFDRVAELERRIAELETKDARRREQQRDRNRRWRERNPEQVRHQTRERMRAYRTRRRSSEGRKDEQ